MRGHRLLLHWLCRWQQFDLPDEETPLVHELVIVGPVVEEVGEEAEEAVAIVDEHALYGV